MLLYLIEYVTIPVDRICYYTGLMHKNTKRDWISTHISANHPAPIG